MREQRIRQVASEFLDLLVAFTHSHEVEEGDAEAVAEARGMVVGTFCLFRGFSVAIASQKFAALKNKWQAAQLAEISIAPPVVGVRVAVPTVARQCASVRAHAGRTGTGTCTRGLGRSMGAAHPARARPA